MMAGLLFPSGPFLHPVDVLVPLGRDVLRGAPGPACVNWRHCSIIMPSLDFGMAIGERKTTRPIVITCRKIKMKAPHGRTVRVASHISEGVAVVDSIFAFIHQHPRAHGAGVNHIRQFGKYAPRRPRAACVMAFPTAHPDAHGHSSHPGNGLTGKRTTLGHYSALIRRAAPNPDRVSAISPKWALFDILFHI